MERWAARISAHRPSFLPPATACSVPSTELEAREHSGLGRDARSWMNDADQLEYGGQLVLLFHYSCARKHRSGPPGVQTCSVNDISDGIYSAAYTLQHNFVHEVKYHTKTQINSKPEESAVSTLGTIICQSTTNQSINQSHR